VHDARIQAMLCYRTPKSFKARFNRSVNTDLNMFNVESWLLHHGNKLQARFQLKSYKLLNQILATIDIAKEGDFLEVASKIESNIHIIGVNSDLYFPAAENKETFQLLSSVKKNVFYGEINSIHGHDAFLIEFKQLEKLLNKVFKPSLKTA
jgi:homoserine acetyltransferase